MPYERNRGIHFEMTEIKEQDFFDIIYKALQDINSDEDSSMKQLEILKKYYKNSKVYYKELALAQAEILYEVHAAVKEQEFWNSLNKKI